MAVDLKLVTARAAPARPAGDATTLDGLDAGQEPEDAIQKYMEGASEEEQKDFAEALLDSRERAARPTYKDVPHRLVVVSRVFAVVAVVASLFMMEWDRLPFRRVFYLPFILAMASFPNEYGAITNRWVLNNPWRRPFTPWATFVLAWIVLLLRLVLSVVTWSAPPN